MADSNPMRGSCHCGRITFSFLSSVPPEKYSPRACDCSFCQRHGALYISDQNGSLVLDIKEADALGEYRFGDKLGKFVFCRNCGVLVAVLFETDGRMFGSVNSRCIGENVKFGDFEIISPQKLNAEQKKREMAQGHDSRRTGEDVRCLTPCKKVSYEMHWIASITAH